jgi:hypothetical protein
VSISGSPGAVPVAATYGTAGANLSPLERRLDLQPGEVVEIRSVAEITATLDDNEKLEGIPLYQEMVP